MYFREAKSFPVTKELRDAIVECWKYPDANDRSRSFSEVLKSSDTVNFETIKLVLEVFFFLFP